MIVGSAVRPRQVQILALTCTRHKTLEKATQYLVVAFHQLYMCTCQHKKDLYACTHFIGVLEAKEIMVIKDLKHEKSSVNTDTHTDEYSAALWAQGIVTLLKV